MDSPIPVPADPEPARGFAVLDAIHDAQVAAIIDRWLEGGPASPDWGDT